jgi:hypothetical protein
MEDLAPAGVLADADGVDAAPGGLGNLRQRGRAEGGRVVRRIERDLCHEVLREFRPVSAFPAIVGTLRRRLLERTWSERGDGRLALALWAQGTGLAAILMREARGASSRPAPAGLGAPGRCSAAITAVVRGMGGSQGSDSAW